MSLSSLLRRLVRPADAAVEAAEKVAATEDAEFLIAIQTSELRSELKAALLVRGRQGQTPAYAIEYAINVHDACAAANSFLGAESSFLGKSTADRSRYLIENNVALPVVRKVLMDEGVSRQEATEIVAIAPDTEPTPGRPFETQAAPRRAKTDADEIYRRRGRT